MLPAGVVGGLMLAALGFCVAVSIYSIVFIVDPNKGGGDKHQWNSINELAAEVALLQNETQCAHCSANGTLYTDGDVFVNGTLWALNTTAGGGVFYDVSQTVLLLWQEFLLLSQQVVQLIVNVTTLESEFDTLNTTVAMNIFHSSLRLEANDTHAITAMIPNTTDVDFPSTGFGGYIYDPTGVFDTSNPFYVGITRNITLQVSAQLYISADDSNTQLLCAIMRYANSPFGMEPTIAAAAGAVFNISFGLGAYTGLVTMVANVQALAGYQITMKCGIIQGTPPVYTYPTSHLDITAGV